jgi:predicted O-methyltransferase YrrM
MDATVVAQHEHMSSLDYEAVIEDFFTTTEKRLASGGTRQIGFDCSVSRDQGRILHQMVRDLKPEASLEIGMAWGGSSVHISCALLENGFGRHVAIDPYEISMWSGIALSEMERLAIDGCLEFVEERSDLVLPEFVRNGRRFQFIFIDGDHRFDGAFVDFHFCQQLLDIEGLLVFDDAKAHTVERVISFARNNMPNLQYLGLQGGRFGVFLKTGEDERAHGDAFDF